MEILMYIVLVILILYLTGPIMKRIAWNLVHISLGLTAFVYIGVLVAGIGLFVILPITCGVLGLDSGEIIRQIVLEGKLPKHVVTRLTKPIKGVKF